MNTDYQDIKSYKKPNICENLWVSVSKFGLTKNMTIVLWPCHMYYRPWLSGSEFKPALVRRDVYLKLLSLYMELGFHHHILICQVWARGSKITTGGYYSQYEPKSGMPVIPHWVKRIFTRMKLRFLWYELSGFFQPGTLNS